MLEKIDFQWIWGVFSAIPKQYSEEEMLGYELPYADGNSDIYKDDSFIIQHPLADIEIVAFVADYDASNSFNCRVHNAEAVALKK